jgi:hypothetical protein
MEEIAETEENTNTRTTDKDDELEVGIRASHLNPKTDLTVDSSLPTLRSRDQIAVQHLCNILFAHPWETATLSWAAPLDHVEGQFRYPPALSRPPSTP